MSRDPRGYPKIAPVSTVGVPSFEYAVSQSQSRVNTVYNGAFDNNRPDAKNSPYLVNVVKSSGAAWMKSPVQEQSSSFSPAPSGSNGGGGSGGASGSSTPKTPVDSRRRSSSSQSIHNISDPPSDDSDEDSPPGARKGQGLRRELRREAHTQAEQKRRDAIKKGYSELEEELPNLQETVGSQKPSKAVVLQRSIDYVNFLEEQKKKESDELDVLKNDYMGLQIMKQAYEKMALAMRNQPDQGSSPVPDEVKFQVFQLMMDSLFQSFDSRVITASFAELSGSAFNWLEEWCTPQHIRSITLSVLNELKNSSNNVVRK